MIGPSPKKSHTSNTSIIEDLVAFPFLSSYIYNYKDFRIMGKRNMRLSAMLVGNSSESTWVLGEHIGSIHGNLMGTWVPPLSTPHPPPRRGKKKKKKSGPSSWACWSS